MGTVLKTTHLQIWQTNMMKPKVFMNEIGSEWNTDFASIPRIRIRKVQEVNKNQKIWISDLFILICSTIQPVGCTKLAD